MPRKIQDQFALVQYQLELKGRAGLEEMGARVGKDRRLFALFHRAMPEEPDEILSDSPEYSSRAAQNTAMFYSINNTQHGLVGLDLGKALILDVMKVIQQDDPRIKFFATLSPIPGLWEGYLERILVGGDASFQLNRSGLNISSRIVCKKIWCGCITIARAGRLPILLQRCTKF